MIDPELYTISVRKESVEGEEFYVARITEFPDVEEYGDTFSEARELALETIRTSYELCSEENIAFPDPIDLRKLSNASGRVTLRMPKSLHAKLTSEAMKEEVSLNQYIVSSLSLNYGQCAMSTSIVKELKASLVGFKNGWIEYQRVAGTFLLERAIYKKQSNDMWVQRLESQI